jgi:hypothetical protein
LLLLWHGVTSDRPENLLSARIRDWERLLALLDLQSSISFDSHR